MEITSSQTGDPTWISFLEDSNSGILAQIAKAIKDSPSQRIQDWQYILGEIEAANPLAQQAGLSFAYDFQKLTNDAKSIDPNNPSISDLTKIQNDLLAVTKDQIPYPQPDQYKTTMAVQSCEALLALVASNPKDQYEIKGMIQLLIDFAAPLQGTYSLDAQQILEMYNTYLQNPSNPLNINNVQLAICRFYAYLVS